MMKINYEIGQCFSTGVLCTTSSKKIENHLSYWSKPSFIFQIFIYYQGRGKAVALEAFAQSASLHGAQKIKYKVKSETLLISFKL
jgi:hypothetical protein